MPIQREHGYGLVGAGLVFFAVVLLRNAWVCDDAFITFRTLDNFFSGYGLVWNTAERVQTYTHPLWLFTLGLWSALSGEFYYTAILLSISITLLALGLYAFGLCRRWSTALLGLVVLLLSKAFVDFSTGGLENPLTHLLLACLFYVYFVMPSGAKQVFLLFLCAALLALSRMDAFLFSAPLLVWVLAASNAARKASAAFFGLLPFFLWELFSLFYYGFLFPNTAYAKLNAGITLSERVYKAWFYYLNSIQLDPITLPVILTAIVLPIGYRLYLYQAANNQKTLKAIYGATPGPAALGIAFYLLYILWIGGDFMSGRFFAAPLFVGVILLSRSPLDEWPLMPKAGLLGVVLLLGLASPLSPVWSDLNYGQGRKQLFDANEITDERGVVYIALGLPNRSLLYDYPQHPRAKEGLALRAKGPSVQIHSAMGLVAFYAGPAVHFVDIYALTDPLLARLPAHKNPLWRPGHLRRAIPEGYIDSLENGENRFDPNNSIYKDLARYYDKLRLITSGPLFSFKRFTTILAMNLGWYAHWVNRDYFRYPGMKKRKLNQINTPIQAGAPWNASGTLRLYAGGVRIALPQPAQARAIELTIDGDDVYAVIFLNNKTELGQVLIAPLQDEPQELVLRRIAVPAHARRRGYTHLHVMPLQGDKQYSLGHVALVEEHVFDFN